MTTAERAVLTISSISDIHSTMIGANRMREAAEQIRGLRRAAGLTQSELAKRLNVRQHYVSRVESGRANLSIRSLERMARGMGKTVQVLFVDLGEAVMDERGRVVDFGGWESGEAKLVRNLDWTPDEIFDWLESAAQFVRDAREE